MTNSKTGERDKISFNRRMFGTYKTQTENVLITAARTGPATRCAGISYCSRDYTSIAVQQDQLPPTPQGMQPDGKIKSKTKQM